MAKAYVLSEADVRALERAFRFLRDQDLLTRPPRGRRRMATPRRWICARITAVADPDATYSYHRYAWTEQRLDADGEWEDRPDGLSGTTTEDPAREMNDTPGAAVDDVVWIALVRRGQLDADAEDDTGEWQYRFRLPAAGGFWGRITSHSSAGSNKWTYGFEEAEKTGTGYGNWTAVSGGRTGTAYNALEDMNAATGTQGNGVDASNLDTGDFTFTVQPCPTNAIVWIRSVPIANNAAEYWFAYANGVDGSCD